MTRGPVIPATVVALALLGCAPTAFGQEAGRILVLPFENVTRDGRIFWLTEASAVLLTDDLNGRDEINGHAITRQERRAAFDRLQAPPAAALTDATRIRIGQIVGATQVVLGSFRMDDAALVVRARSIALDTGRVQAEATEQGPLTDLFAIFERVARRLAPPPALSASPALSAVGQPQPPVAAFEDFVKGLLASTPATAIGYFNAALKREPSFDRARLALWDVYADQGDHEQALAVIEAVPAPSAFADRARFLAALSQINLKRNDAAFATLTRLAETHPAPAILNNLGVIQIRRGGSAQTGQPAYYFNKAADGDPGDPDYVFNLGYAYWQDHDPKAALFWLREAVRRRPADADAHFVLAAALEATGSAAESARERELARRLSSAYEGKRKGPDADVPRGLERVKTDAEMSPAARLDARLASTGQRDQAELAQFHLERGRRLFEQNNDRDAAAELGRALYLSPYLAEAHLLSGRLHLRNGREREAIDAFKVALWSAEAADAEVADAARALLQRLTAR